ncbi:hypothetical protein JKF63_03795 [Porcisia hertigi]|uniref:Uncharacterized protein n=1 Tax=Porcisia hertigi TaxID=2761500 RepID=A0A836IH70_9TRYP|nr:hypothetical protein JKF63_03795 [Porcisia hertigi]
MAFMISDTCASPQRLSKNAEKHCAADICALDHRLGRCVRQVEMLMASSTGDSAPFRYHGRRSTTSCIRRLGELLREAKELEQRVAAESSDNTGNTQETTESVDDDTDTPLGAYYRQQLQACFTHIQQDANAAQKLLAQFLSKSPTLAHLPVSCVGTAPQTLEHGFTASAAASFDNSSRIYADVVPPRAACIPPAAVHSVEGPSSSWTEAQDPSPIREGAAQTKATPAAKGRMTTAVVTSASFSAHPNRTPSAAGATISAEDCIMEDIQQAIHQMKDGALQMSALMAQEKSQMKSANDLLSGGVAKSQANMRQLDRVSYVGEAQRAPWILKHVPGMPILWRTVLQPMWAFLKQVLLMVSIIAVTGCMVLLIGVVPKPVVYRGQRSDTPNSRTPPQIASALTPVPLTTTTPPPPEVNVDPSVPAEVLQNISMPLPRDESPLVSLSDDL